jgi:hypothetical protein
MREDLAHYGVIDGLAPEGRCSLHAFTESVAADVRYKMFPTVHWSPFAAERFPILANNPSEVPTIAVLGAHCPPHPLLPNLQSKSFISQEEALSELDNLRSSQVNSGIYATCIATHCLGLIGAKSSYAFESMAPHCNLLSLEVLNENGVGTSSVAAKAIHYAIQEKVQVICIPLTYPLGKDSKGDTQLKDALQQAANNGIVVLARKGNGSYSFPADEPSVCSVCSYDRKFEFSHQTEIKNNLADVAVPGEGLWSLHPILGDILLPEDISTYQPGEILFCRMSGSAIATCLLAGFVGRLATKYTVNLRAQFVDLLAARMFNVTNHPFPFKAIHLLSSAELKAIQRSPEIPYEFYSPNKSFNQPPSGNPLIDPNDPIASQNVPVESISLFDERLGISPEDLRTSLGLEIPETIKKEEIDLSKTSDQIKPVIFIEEENLNLNLNSNETDPNLANEEKFNQVQKQIYEELNQVLSEQELDKFLTLRIKQHHLLAPTHSTLQPFLFPQQPLNLQTSEIYHPVAIFGILDWIFNYFVPFPHRKEATNSPNHSRVELTPEAIYILLSKRISDEQFLEMLWNTLRACKGHAYDNWFFFTTLITDENLSSLFSQIHYEQSKSELKAIKLFLRPSTLIPNIWEFCRRLNEIEGVADAEPFFLETIVEPLSNKHSYRGQSAVPKHVLGEYLGIEPDYDISEIGDDIKIAHLDSGYQKHECLYRSNFLFEEGWDYIRHRSWKSISDCYSMNHPSRAFGLKPEIEPEISPEKNPTGIHGLGTLSVITGIHPLIYGLSPNSNVVPLRCYSEIRQSFPSSQSQDQMRHISIVHQSATRLIDGILHARKIKADVISVNFSLVTSSYNGYLRRILKAAEKENIIVCSSAGNFVRIPDRDTGRSTIYPPSGGVGSPGRFPEVLCSTGCKFEAVPWESACCGTQVDVSSLSDNIAIAAYSPVDSSAVIGGSGGSLTASTLASLAALWLSYHGKAKLIRLYSRIAPLNAIFKYVLRNSLTVPPGWRVSLFGDGTTRNIISSLIEHPLPSPVEIREFIGTRKRCIPSVFGLDFTSDALTVHLQREIAHLSHTDAQLRKFPRDRLYQEILGCLSPSSQQELALLIETLPFISFNPRFGLIMQSEGYFITTSAEVSFKKLDFT